jgi:hypothetical protein
MRPHKIQAAREQSFGSFDSAAVQVFRRFYPEGRDFFVVPSARPA